MKDLLRAIIPGVAWLPKAKKYERKPTGRPRSEGPAETTREEDAQHTEEPGPGLDSLYDEVLSVRVGASRSKPPAVKEPPTSDYIADICRSFIDLERLRELDTAGELTGILDIITDKEVFQQCFLPGALSTIEADRSFRLNISKHMKGYLEALKDFQVLEEADSAKVVLHGFTVEKSSGGLRFVLDGRRLNGCMVHPPDMLLPRITEVVEQVVRADWAVLTDGLSWFYQFPVHPYIRDFFGVNLGKARGDFTCTRMKALCMGWKFAPCIAHRAARALLPPDEGATWVDNFIITGASAAGAAAAFHRFMKRCDSVNAKMNLHQEGYGTPTQHFSAFGLSFDLARHRFRTDPKWIQKFLSRQEYTEVLEGQSTPRGVYKVVGSLVWHSYTTRRPLCFLRATLSFMRDLSRETLSDVAKWDMATSVRPSVVQDIKARVRCMQENRWVDLPPARSVVAWSDASSASWAAVLEGTELQVAQGDFDNEMRQWHIYVKELYAARQAVALTARSVGASRVLLKVDNLPAVHSIQRGHSSDYMSNGIIGDMFMLAERANLHIVCSWVSTTEQKADKYTRGCARRRQHHPATMRKVVRAASLRPWVLRVLGGSVQCNTQYRGQRVSCSILHITHLCGTGNATETRRTRDCLLASDS